VNFLDLEAGRIGGGAELIQPGDERFRRAGLGRWGVHVSKAGSKQAEKGEVLIVQIAVHAVIKRAHQRETMFGGLNARRAVGRANCGELTQDHPGQQG
jgi:hypothetical protein